MLHASNPTSGPPFIQIWEDFKLRKCLANAREARKRMQVLLL